MSQPIFLADNDLNEQIVQGVLRRERAIVFGRVRDIGLAGAPDADVLAYAADHGYILVSHDVNTMPAAAFARLSAHLPMPGLFLSRQTGAAAPVIDSLVLIWSASDAEEWQGQVLFLPL